MTTTEPLTLSQELGCSVMGVLVEHHQGGPDPTIQMLADRMQRVLDARLLPLMEALQSAREYMRHDPGCSAAFGAQYRCRCRLADALEQIDAALKDAGAD